jgi:hypothetical protein
MEELEVYLKSGHTISIQCEKWRFTRDNNGDGYSGYEFEGLVNPESIGITISQIVGYSANTIKGE